MEGHGGAILSIDVNKDSTLVATGSGDGTARLWDLKSGKQLFKWNTISSVKYVNFSPSGDHLLVVTDGNFGFESALRIYKINYSPTSPEDHIPIESQNEQPILTISNSDGSNAKYIVGAFTYDSKHIVVGLFNGNVVKYNIEGTEGKVVATVTAHDQAVSDLQMSLDRTYFITSSRDKKSKLFSTDDLTHLRTYEGQAPLNSACITPVKDFVIVGGGQDAGSVTTTSNQEGDFKSKIFHKVFEDLIGDVRGHFGPINSLAADPKGKSFASGGEDGFIRLHHFDQSYFDFYYDIESRNKEGSAVATN